jgi:XTP/dITP diphosphohydrolase
MQHLFLASRNPHKTRELAAMLKAEFAVEDLREHPEIAEVMEVGATFAENARLKAVAISRQLPGLVLSDDSGLEVDSLGGKPGVFSARYSGENATDEMNRRKLLDQMAQLAPGASRAARFRSILALARDGAVLAVFEGMLEGKILRAERGESGFGYDSLFLPDGLEKTLAELSPKEKNAISHRAAAVAQFRSFLETADFSGLKKGGG